MDDETDETITRIAAALRQLPPVDATHKARVLVAVAAERERARETRLRAARRWRLTAAMGAAAAAALVLFVWRRDAGPGPVPARTAVREASAGPPAAASAHAAPSPATQLTSSDAAAVAPLPIQLVLRAPAAHRVSVVGDFNGWDTHAHTLRRDAASGLWSVTLALRPGRHVYAFIVDDSIWTRDPRMPESRDADFGRPGSVLLVGRP
jgi:hypothetical protein